MVICISIPKKSEACQSSTGDCSDLEPMTHIITPFVRREEEKRREKQAVEGRSESLSLRKFVEGAISEVTKAT